MRKCRKIGFTLAEILIVLIIIGIIATLTIPGVMAGVREGQYKTAYKKAYNDIVNLCAAAATGGGLPVKAENKAVGSTYTTFFLYLPEI